MSHTYDQLITPGRDGDKTVIVKMTARQIAMVELLLASALDHGVGALVLHAVAETFGLDMAERSRLEFNIALKRLGIAKCRVLGDDELARTLTADLARLDGEVAGL